MTRGLLGDNLDPRAQQALEVLNNPNAPDYLKSIASTMLKGAVPIDSAPQRGGRAAKPRSGAAPGASPRPRLYGDIVEVDGVPGKYDGAGKWWPLLGPDGNPAPAKAPPGAAPGAPASPAASPAAPRALPPDPVLPADPVMPADPRTSSLTDDELLNRY